MASRHHSSARSCVSITRHGDTLEGPKASILVVPGPGCAALPLSAELTAGSPAKYVLRPRFILSRFSLDIDTRTWEFST